LLKLLLSFAFIAFMKVAFIQKYLGQFGLSALMGLGVVLSPQPSHAAERLVLHYDIFRGAVSIPELATFAETGELSPKLNNYLDRADQDPDSFQKALNRKVEIDPIFLYRALRTTPGKAILDEASEAIYTPSRRADRQALRGAIVSSALLDGEITAIELLQKYPTDEVHVEVDRLLATYEKVDQFMSRLPSFLLD
jgi:hypothetical protein